LAAGLFFADKELMRPMIAAAAKALKTLTANRVNEP
jgi:hypothetical protein